MRRLTVLAFTFVLLLALTSNAALFAQEPVPPTAPDLLDAFALPASPDAPLGSAFTYQGLLESGGVPANGTFDFQFSLFNAITAGTQRGATLTRSNVPVARGIFNVQLDYGDIYTNELLWIQVSVRPGASSGAYTPLTPRQPLTPSPYTRFAMRATAAGTAVTAQEAQALALPWYGPFFSTQTLFSLYNGGTGGVARFESANGTYPIVVVNSGTGGGLFVQTGNSGTSNAIHAYHFGSEGYAGFFDLSNTSKPRAGLFARTSGNGSGAQVEVNEASSSATALFVRTTSTNIASSAAHFVGDVSITGSNAQNPGNLYVQGTLTKGAGAFRIDHPLDPQYKYLQHSFVESPDMMNVYNGNATLDGAGEAAVQLPDWFEALNKDFRYQLTALGAPMPNLYVAQGVQGNTFRIAGGAPGGQVSWQVTGIRHDAFAEANPILVEVPKTGEEVGTYLHPESFGLPAEMGASAASLPAIEPATAPDAALSAAGGN